MEADTFLGVEKLSSTDAKVVEELKENVEYLRSHKIMFLETPLECAERIIRTGVSKLLGSQPKPGG